MLTDYQKENKDKAQAIANELKAVGYGDVIVEKNPNEISVFDAILTVDKVKYRVYRDYNQVLHINPHFYKRCDNISSHKQGEIYREIFKSNNCKVFTTKKIAEKIAENVEYLERSEELETKNKKTIADFLDTLKRYGKLVKYNYNQDYKTDEKTGAYELVNTTISGGSIEKNGIEFTFELGEDGYVSKKLALLYSLDNDLATFDRLSDNKI